MNAKSPAILMGRVSRSEAAWKARIALAEKLQARVFTDIKTPAAFPTDHPLHAAPPADFPDGKLLKDADVILSLDWVDTAGTLKAAWGVSDQGHASRSSSATHPGPLFVSQQKNPSGHAASSPSSHRSRQAAVCSSDSARHSSGSITRLTWTLGAQPIGSPASMHAS